MVECCLEVLHQLLQQFGDTPTFLEEILSLAQQLTQITWDFKLHRYINMIAYITIAIWCFAYINIDGSQFNMWLFYTHALPFSIFVHQHATDQTQAVCQS